jgi:hypothetical protein
MEGDVVDKGAVGLGRRGEDERIDRETLKELLQLGAGGIGPVPEELHIETAEEGSTLIGESGCDEFPRVLVEKLFHSITTQSKRFLPP